MKRLISALMMVLLVFTLCMPQSVRSAQASTKVKVKYKGTTRTYSKKKTYIYINGKKKKLSSKPVFLKSGAYVGPLSAIFTNSALKVKTKKSGSKITLTYKKNKLTLTDGSKTVTRNGKKEKNALGATPMKSAKYAGTSSSLWIVPLKSTCSRLGIGYQMKDGTIYLNKNMAAAKSTTTTVTPANTASEATTQTQPQTAQGQVVLTIDAGHGGIDSGASGKLYREKNLTLAIVLAAKQYFDKDNRFKVIYTRTADTYPSLDDRCKIANDNNSDLFLCVHINSASSSATGTETLYNNSRNTATQKNGISSKELATAMQRAALAATGFPNRGLVNRTGLRVLNKTKMPACLIEYGFISNATEEKIMHANTSRYGKALYDAVVDFMKSKGRIQ